MGGTGQRGREHWVVPLAHILLQFAIVPAVEQGWVTSGQTALREGVQPRPSANDWIEVSQSKALPIRARPSVSHHQSLPSRSLHKPVSLIHQRADRRSKKKHSLTVAKTKTILWKVNHNEKAESYIPDEGQDKTREKQLNEVEIGNLSEKEFRIMIVKMIQDLGKRMEAKIEKMQEMFAEELEELKKQTNE